MECEDVEVANGVDDCIPAPVSFWQKTGLRLIITIALFGPAGAVFVTQYFSARHQLTNAVTKTQPQATPPLPPENTIKNQNAAAESIATPTAPVTVDVIANPPRSVTDRPGGLQLETKPTGVTFAIYSGISADKTPPASPPLRSGTSPGTVEDLHSGNYTVFFHKEGWPDSRTEIQVEAGEVLPVAYAFPHGEVTITSDPTGAEILLGSASLGFSPLKVDLPPGEQEVTARLKNYPDRKQTVTVNDNSTAVINFRMRVQRHTARVKPAPTPSLIDRFGSSLKHLFGGRSNPAQARKH